VPDQAAIAPLPGRDRALVAICIGLITILAWGYLVGLERQMSASMAYSQMMADMGMAMNEPWHAADIVFTIIMWAVMMVGMMAPSAAPVLLLFAASVKARHGSSLARPVIAFGTGYVLIWSAFSAAAALTQWRLHEAALMSAAMASSSRTLSALILVGAGLYQLTPVKNACLTRCRSPLGFLMTRWRGGTAGAFRMGVDHGVQCLGCCWALMCVLFAVGVMNLLWVAAISAFVLVEKVGPRGILASRLAGAAIIGGGLFVLVRSY
jgi:predicted metal-binding membrane protein